MTRQDGERGGAFWQTAAPFGTQQHKARLAACVKLLGWVVFIATAAWAQTPKRATFDARHELKVTVPDGAKRVRVWFTVPQDVPQQQVSDFKVESPFPYRIERDATEGNKFLYVEVNNPTVKEFTLVTTFRLTCNEVLNSVDPAKTRPLTDAERRGVARYLEPNQHVIIDERIRQIAREVVGEEKNPIIAARRIYDWVLEYADYWVKDPANKKASPVGSTDYCLTTKTGNCTDFHSLWASVARAAGIPTRIVYGSFFKKELDGKDIDQSYHCWPEFYAPNIGWIAHDVAIADLFVEDIKLTPENTTLVQRTTAAGYFGKDLKMVDYYFGNLEERRVTWSVGRDLVLSPKQDGGPVNAIPKAYVEIDGRVAAEGATGNWVRKLTYSEVKS
ncbi:MAG: transglutaminase domain-containing protein [Abditibacteriales bacterium]|nr:transglutaminase domain-containing protein [Abditibacteriales bacterium]MDW8366938.1 transglutaminase domain-containing protein [Abditibacteriales bacterium]